MFSAALARRRLRGAIGTTDRQPPFGTRGTLMRVITRTLSLAALGAALTAVPSHAVQAQAKLNDPTIVAIFDAANTWDIETSGLGVKKGTTKAIRDLAAQLVRDHTMVRQQGRDLAAKLKVTPT